MTTNTTEDPDPDVRSSTAIEPALAGEPPPAAAGPHASSEPDLESRIKEKRAALISKLGDLRGDVRPEASESRDKLKAKLSDLTHILKWGVVDGWASLGD
ncbi:MAG TPA: hypothetical protein VFT22_02160, partial [Kofleriaceae bacterium]|nr:hypothetical protein [Kofleriaceae bacterium]